MVEIILPGNKVPISQKANGTYMYNNAVYASVVGMLDEEKKFIPLEGLWYPKPGDRVIGKIITRKVSVYLVDLDSPYKGVIITKYEHEKFEDGDIVEATVREFREFEDAMTVVLSRPKKLYGGILLRVRPPKIPRIIGRGNTMLNQITEATKCSVLVGMNGTIWLKGGNINLASKAIAEVEALAHTQGLTDRIKRMLEENKS